MKFEEFLNYVREKAVEIGIPSIPKTTGNFLSFLTYIESKNKKKLNIVEMGAGIGYSTLCMCYGVLRANGNCRIHAIEKEKEIFEMGNKILGEGEKIFKIKLKKFIKFYLIEAENLKGNEFKEIDLFFLDINKESYFPTLIKFEKNIKKGGTVIAHNVLSHKEILKDFLKHIEDENKYKTFFIETDPKGLSLSFKIF